MLERAVVFILPPKKKIYNLGYTVIDKKKKKRF